VAAGFGSGTWGVPSRTWLRKRGRWGWGRGAWTKAKGQLVVGDRLALNE